MSRYPRYGDIAYTFGPGAPTPAVKALLIANVVGYMLGLIVPQIIRRLGLSPLAVFEQMAIWQPVTYMFLHGGVGHILFNMLSLWMFGTDLERRWGTRFFTKYYFVTGLGAAGATLLLSISPLEAANQVYFTTTIGASGAIYGILVAYGMYFPHRTILLLIFPVPARYYVIIAGAIVFLSSVGDQGGGVAHWAHLGGLVVGYFYLKGLSGRPFDAIKYRWLRWKMRRARSRFDVHSGGRGRDDDSWKSDWKKHIH